jgi:uncharacterized repeat protein (TIGR02543 family)
MTSGCTGNHDDDNFFTIYFRDDNGTSLGSKEVSKGEMIQLPDDPVKEDYVFEGWYLDRELRKPYNEKVDIQFDSVLYAKWTKIPKLYSLIFYDDDGSILQQVEVEYGTYLTEDVIPVISSKDGMDFEGWNNEIPERMPSSDISIYAKYNEHNYFTNEGISFSDNYTIFSDGKNQIFINKIDDSSYERIIDVFPESNEDTELYFYGVKEMNLVVVLVNPETDILDVHFYKLDDSQYHQVIESSLVKSDNPISMRFDIEFVGDYIVISGFYCGYCCMGDPNTVYIFKLGDIGYHRIVQRDKIFTYECEAYRVDLKIIGNYIFFYDNVTVDNRGTILIYDIYDEEYKQMIVSGQLFGEFPRLIPISMRGEYLITVGYSRMFSQSFITIFSIEDTEYVRTIFASDITPDDNFASSFLIEEDYIVMGGKYINNNQGSIYVYKFSDPSYERIIKGTDTKEEDYFGTNISIEGDKLVTGSYSNLNGEGKVFVYSLVDEEYERIITNTSEALEDAFGTSVGVYGDYVLVNEYACFNYANNCFGSKHKVHLYKLSDDNYVKIIDLDTIDMISLFPKDVFWFEIVGDYLLAVSPKFDHNKGLVAIYDLNKSHLEPIILAYGEEYFDNFGIGIYFDGKTLIIGDNVSIELFTIE